MPFADRLKQPAHQRAEPAFSGIPTGDGDQLNRTAVRLMGWIALVGSVVGLSNLLIDGAVWPGWRTAVYATGMAALLVLSIILLVSKRHTQVFVTGILLLASPMFFVLRICLVEAQVFAPSVNMVICVVAGAIALSPRWFVVQCVITVAVVGGMQLIGWSFAWTSFVVQVFTQSAMIIGIAVGVFLLRRRVESLVETLRRASVLDELTGLPNRRQVRMFAQRVASSADGTGAGARPLVTVVVFDVDRFKSVNDQYGHQAGDQVLQAVASNLMELITDTSLVCRLGGEEFAVLAEVGDQAAATSLVEQVRALVAGADGPVRVTASAGVAVARLPETADPVEWLWAQINQADQALFRAKRAGRDRYAFASSARLRTRTPAPAVGSSTLEVGDEGSRTAG